MLCDESSLNAVADSNHNCYIFDFPFLRRVVSDLTQDGGFPALNLETIDFMQLYRSEALRRQTEAASEETKN